MIEKLIAMAFEKAKLQTGNDSINGRAEYLAYVMTEDYDTAITGKSMTRYYQGKSSPKLKLRNALANYLGYNTYEDFVLDNLPEEEREVINKAEKKVEKKKYFLDNCFISGDRRYFLFCIFL